MSESATLRTVLATSPLSAPIKSGALSSPRASFDFVEVSPVHKAFAPWCATRPSISPNWRS